MSPICPEVTETKLDTPAQSSDEKSAPIAPPLLVPIREAARLLGVSRSTAWNLVKDGRLALVHIGRRALIQYHSIEKLAEGQH